MSEDDLIVPPLTEAALEPTRDVADPTAAAAEPVGDPAKLDPVALAAVDLARAGAVELGGEHVGEYVGAAADGPGVVTHSFAATLPGYRGWHWAITVAHVGAGDAVTVDESVLLPGPEALLAPVWLPWAERVRPGDLGAGDLLPPIPDDPRLVPAYADDADDKVIELGFEIGLGRVRVLSRDGRLDAADRWVAGEGGPDTPMARQAPARCGTCGFLVPVSGSLRAAFGVCANEYSSADGRAVSVEYGCGAHSETTIVVPSLSEPSGVVFDDDQIVPI